MTRRFTQIMLTAGLSAMLGTFGLSAQSNNTEVADVPFAFHAEGRWFPAGEYRLVQRGDSGLIQLFDSTGSSIYVNARIKMEGETDNPRLTFRCYGNDRILSEVWTESGMGYGVSKSAIERQLHRSLDMSAIISVKLKAR